MGSQENHGRLVNAILVALTKLPHCRIWKNSTGVARSIDGARAISFGLKGSADIIGLLGPNGHFIAIEVKTGNARQTKQQVAFQAMIARLGGTYLICRSLDDAVSFAAFQANK